MGPGQVGGGPNPDRVPDGPRECGGPLRVRGSAQSHHPKGKNGWRGGEFAGRAIPTKTSPLPNELDGFIDPGIEAVMHGAAQGGGFEKLFLRMIGWQRNCHLGLQGHDTPR